MQINFISGIEILFQCFMGYYQYLQNDFLSHGITLLNFFFFTMKKTFIYLLDKDALRTKFYAASFY